MANPRATHGLSDMLSNCEIDSPNPTVYNEHDTAYKYKQQTCVSSTSTEAISLHNNGADTHKQRQEDRHKMTYLTECVEDTDCGSHLATEDVFEERIHASTLHVTSFTNTNCTESSNQCDRYSYRDYQYAETYTGVPLKTYMSAQHTM